MANASCNVFDIMGDIWAEIADKNQTQLQIQFIKNHLEPEGCVLDLACGTGRHLIPLSAEGYGMVGLDVSKRLLKIAKQRSANMQLVRGDLRFLPFKNDVFTAAISMDTSLGYLPSEKEDMESLAEVKRALKLNSVVIVDVFNRAYLVGKYRGKEPSFKTYEYSNFTLQQKRTVSDKGDWLRDVWLVKNKSDGHEKVFEHSVRLYGALRLQELLKIVGFKISALFGDYEGQNFHDGFPRLIVVAVVK
jgi:SAM-dependent methyltransferase